MCAIGHLDRIEGGNVTLGLVAVPMHGETKIRTEGLRTRDGHMLEWFARLRPSVQAGVYSRPEPWPRVTLARLRGATTPSQLVFVSPQPRTIPNLRHRRDWWIQSQRFMPSLPSDIPAVIWNPISGAAALRAGHAGPLVFDLLDDWLVHPAFERLREDIKRAYGVIFSKASLVTANSEATLELAREFGRHDAVLLRNGVDPERFSLPPSDHSTITVGYGGKLGFRIDVELVASVASRLPHVRFEFAGPSLAKEQTRALRRIPNVVLLGDVRYDRYPELMRRWDVAWAPHRLGEFEVGGDLIKLYEYRAAGLPTVSTKVIGWERALDGVRAVAREDIGDAIAGIIAGFQAGGIPREPISLPYETTWRAKSEFIVKHLELPEPIEESSRMGSIS